MIELTTKYTNIYDFAAGADDVVVSLLIVGACVGIFGAGYWIISYVVSKICGND